MQEKILVVDDEKGIRLTFETFLSDEGYEVRTARSYEEAVACISQTDFDLVFVDIILGGKTGIDVLGEVRRRNPTCPVIMITGYPNIETASEALRLGAFDYIPKPVVQQTLLHVAGKALAHKRLVDEKERYRSNLEAIFKSVKEAIITIDDHMVVLELNNAVEHICGFTRDAIGKVFATLPMSCGGRCLEALRDTLEERRPIELHRFNCHHKDRPNQVVALTACPFLDHQDEVSGCILVMRDETRIEDLERDLAKRDRYHNMIGRSEKMQRIYSLIDALSDVPTTVLITGESGTGKELVAKAIHYLGARKHGPFVKVNCSTLSESLLESELFGHVKGAFTGAIKDKVGCFEKADGGTIFLDEIGDLSPKIQLKLLRVLQDMEFERVGDSTPIKVDVRVVAATNRDLHAKIKEGVFREDVYYRLKVVEIHMQPLRERREDIPLLVDYFISKFNMKLNKDIDTVTPEAKELLMSYAWPGNVRELEHAIEHAILLSRTSVMDVDDLPAELGQFHEVSAPCVAEGDDDLSKAILKALEKTAWNKSKAAMLLGMSRSTLYRKISDYNLKVEDPFQKPGPS
jgi:two-component system, NtrC family, response regulator HydG